MTPETPTTDEAGRLLWRAVLVGGVLTLAIGAFLAFWPDLALTAIAWLVALQFILLGAAFLIGRLVAGESTGSVILGVVLGAAGIWVGVIAFRNPTALIAVLTFVIGAGWFISGVVEAIEAVADGETPARGWVIVLGLISAAAGLVLLFYPVESAATLAVITGVFMLVVGVARVVMAFRIKGELGV